MFGLSCFAVCSCNQKSFSAKISLEHFDYKFFQKQKVIQSSKQTQHMNFSIIVLKCPHSSETKHSGGLYKDKAQVNIGLGVPYGCKIAEKRKCKSMFGMLY